MLKIRIIPCLDVHEGRVVKGVNFVDLVDAGDPVEAARAYDAAGADELCFLDISASHEGRDTLIDVVRRTAEQYFMPLTVGGGVREVGDVRKLLLAGADKVSFNTAAVNNPDMIDAAAEKFGSQCIVVALDAKQVDEDENGARWKSSRTAGAKQPALRRSALPKIWRRAGPVKYFSPQWIATAPNQAFDLKLTRAIADADVGAVIASGGVGTLQDLVDGVRDGHASYGSGRFDISFGTYTIGEARAAFGRGRSAGAAVTVCLNGALKTANKAKRGAIRGQADG